LHGGGNFGDLWTRHQHFREQVILDFPRNPIIQLPQTIYFQKIANFERAKRVLNSHQNLTLLLRDQNSLAIAQDGFNRPTLLCPDMAFSLDLLDRPREPSERVVCLAREDQESRGENLTFDRPGVRVVDWLEEGLSKIKRLNSLQRKFIIRYPGLWRVLGQALSYTDELMAKKRVQRGCELLAQGHFVITDRLHGHILCLLMGIPHIILDNRYGKLSSFYNTWTKDCKDSSIYSSFSEAYEKIKIRL
jgi:pyruvyl transferase EpsO